MADKASSSKTSSSKAQCNKAASYKTRPEAGSTGSAAAKARAKAEAAKARLNFAGKEMSLKLEKAKLEASMELLQQEKDLASAIAEAEALEAAVASQLDAQSDPTPSETAERTKRYVITQATFVDSEKSRPLEPLQNNTKMKLKQEHTSNELSQPGGDNYNNYLTPHASLPNADYSQYVPASYFSRPDKPNNSSWSHKMSESTHCNPYQEPGGGKVSDFIRYFARREIVATGFLQFNDKPQNYRAWKRSFNNVIRGLDLTASEEMDLMLKWLGKESAEHVEQIRAIHINNPVAGLEMIWDRLEQCYGSAEVIEDALFKRVDSFSKIASKDYVKLRKFSDLLMEMQCAKAEGDLLGLSFLDTARGVNPIIQKLPYNLQEKWITVGTNYKRQNGVTYPPFSVFVDFVTQEANARNDPSFQFGPQADSPPKPDKLPWTPNRQKEISVHKTDVSLGYNRDIQIHPNKRTENEKLCPLHKKAHPLTKCRTFCMKPLDERKTFLKENNICFKCCASAKHIAKDCKVKLQCSECGNERHCAALHPGPAPWQTEPEPNTEPSAEHGGEPDNAQPDEITSKCTQVCGENEADRSCSKICLVKVYPVGCPDKAVPLYAIHEEQSNRSLVRPEFFELFNDCGPSSPYSLRTCAGVKETMGRRATGYIVEALDGTVQTPLPSLIECKNIPNDRDEIPTPNAAMHHSHLKSVAHLIPDLDSNAQILMLLGRDIVRVHKVRKQISGPHNASYAQKLDLGWVIVGNLCLGDVHTTLAVKTLFTNVTEKGRPTMLKPCPNVYNVKEKH